MLNGQLALDHFGWSWLQGQIQQAPGAPPESVTILHLDTADGVQIDVVFRADDLVKFQEGTAHVQAPSAIQAVGAMPVLPRVEDILRSGRKG